MATNIGRARLKTTGGKTRVEPPKPRRSVSKAIGDERKAARKAAAWATAAKGKVEIKRKGSRA